MAIKREQVRALLMSSGRPYKAEAKRAAIEYANARRRTGASFTAIGKELGLSAVTVEGWVASGALVPVEVVGVREARESSALILIDTRRGLRVEGLNVDELTQLLGRLR